MLISRHLASIGAAAVMLVSVQRSTSLTRFWGADGHRIVAQVALNRLSPAVADETRHLLDGQNITDVASWADEHRREMPQASPWHYVDIEIYDSTYVPARDCKNDDCIIAQLDRNVAILGNRSLPDSTRGTALKWVVHLVGDLHQPLHAGERNDQGGNSVKLTFDGKQTNLHSLWDSGLLLSWGETDDQVEQHIMNEISHRSDIAAISGGTMIQWAMESHDIARDMVYRDLPQSLVIDQHYADTARPIIQERLLRAGVRLAALLERTLGRAAQ
jgi:hypothetical protein